MSRELTTKEKRLIAQSVVKNCANYDRHYEECLPLDGSCYMMTIGFTDSSLCRYYEKCILPLEAEISEIFSRYGKNLKTCLICGKRFLVFGNQRYCSAECTVKAKKMADAKRARKYRQKRRV